MDLIAITFGGLEPVLAHELRSMGARDVRTELRAVRFRGTMELLYRANLELRTALRVLRPIARFDIRAQRDLYRAVQRTDWERLMGLEDTLAVDTAVRSTLFRHTKYPGLVVKDAIVDQFRARHGRRPSVDTREPTLRIHLHIRNRRCTISLDSSGQSLHRRGYRLEHGKAPLSEVVAAAIVLYSGWDRASTLVDPMCGSGTVVIEAALIAMNRPPGLVREHFGFMRWRDYDPALWHRLRETAQHTQLTAPPCSIIGVDRSSKAVAHARENAERAGLGNAVRFVVGELERYTPPSPPGTVLMNPPYGHRIPVGDIADLAKLIGARLHDAYQGYRAWIINSEPAFFDGLGLQAVTTYQLDSGGLPCELRGHDIGRHAS